MITINLASRKQSAFAQEATGMTGTFSVNIKTAASAFQSLNLGRIMIYIVIGAVAYVGIGVYEDQLLNDEGVNLQKEQALSAKMDQELAKAGEFEKEKANLEQQERMYETKISAIGELVKDRSRTSRIFRHLSSSLPKDSWVSEISSKDSLIRLEGFAYDNILVSELMKNLGQVVYFKDIDLKSTAAVKDGSADIVTFSLETPLRRDQK